MAMSPLYDPSPSRKVNFAFCIFHSTLCTAYSFAENGPSRTPVPTSVEICQNVGLIHESTAFASPFGRGVAPCVTERVTQNKENGTTRCRFQPYLFFISYFLYSVGMTYNPLLHLNVEPERIDTKGDNSEQKPLNVVAEELYARAIKSELCLVNDGMLGNPSLF